MAFGLRGHRLLTGTFKYFSHFSFSIGKMQKAQCDAKGRIYLREKTRKKYGKKFVVVEAPGELILLPIPDDPVKDLEELGKPLRGLSIKEIKRRIRERAMKEVLDGLRRH